MSESPSNIEQAYDPRTMGLPETVVDDLSPYKSPLVWGPQPDPVLPLEEVSVEPPRVTPRWRKHGLTDRQYLDLLESQGYCCAVCRKPFDGTPAIDHDHTCCPGAYSCGACVRGLLCRQCNTGIGMLGDNIAGVEAALAYLRLAL